MTWMQLINSSGLSITYCLISKLLLLSLHHEGFVSPPIFLHDVTPYPPPTFICSGQVLPLLAHYTHSASSYLFFFNTAKKKIGLCLSISLLEFKVYKVCPICSPNLAKWGKPQQNDERGGIRLSPQGSRGEGLKEILSAV